MRPSLSGLGRRRFAGAMLGAAGGLLVPAAPASAAATRPGLRLCLPGPTGPQELGRVSLHLVDPDRQDPWWDEPHPRELMADLWYPARRSRSHRLAPWMSPGVLASFVPQHETFLSRHPDTQPGEEPVPLDVSLDGVEFPVSHARRGAPADTSTGPLPVVVFSPGFGANREFGTALVEDLASHGYLVVTVGHTYEAGQVEFPDGRIERRRPERNPRFHVAMARRRQDVQLVLDKLALLADGSNPDAGHAPLPAGLRAGVDMARIGMFGHSLGGATTAATMARDERLIAGINLDGSFFVEDVDPSTAEPGEMEEAAAAMARRITRPFVFMAAGGGTPDEQEGTLFTEVWSSLPGWARFLSLADSKHATFTDNAWMIGQLATAGILPFSAPWIGRLAPDRALAAQRAYLLATFDTWLRGRPSPLLETASPDYPEVRLFRRD